MLDFVFAVVNDKICVAKTGTQLRKGYESVAANFSSVATIRYFHISYFIRRVATLV